MLCNVSHREWVMHWNGDDMGDCTVISRVGEDGNLSIIWFIWMKWGEEKIYIMTYYSKMQYELVKLWIVRGKLSKLVKERVRKYALF